MTFEPCAHLHGSYHLARFSSAQMVFQCTYDIWILTSSFISKIAGIVWIVVCGWEGEKERRVTIHPVHVTPETCHFDLHCLYRKSQSFLLKVFAFYFGFFCGKVFYGLKLSFLKR